MVRSAPSCVESKKRIDPPVSPLFGTLEASCPCGCGGKTFRWAEGAPLAVCFRTMAGVRELILRAPLASVQKHLLHVFLHHTRDQRECWPSEQRLLLATGVRSRQTLSTHKKALRELGLVDWVRPSHPANPRSCSLYRLSWEALQQLVEARMQAPAPEILPWSSAAPSTPDFSPRELAPLSAESAEGRAELVLDEVLSTDDLPPLESAPAPVGLPEPADATPPLLPAEIPVDATPPSALPPCEPTLPAPSVAPAPSAPSVPGPRVEAPRPAFVVSVALVWNLWRETYQQAYGRPYVQTAADRSAAQQIAGACASAVLHREQRADLAPDQREAQARAYLQHVFKAFLKRPGRRDFLRERRHPLSLLPADLNALGEPWSTRPTVADKPAPLPPSLPREEQLARCREVQRALVEARGTTRPRILKSV